MLRLSMLRETFALAQYVLKWVLISLVLGFIVGSGCAVFLWALELVTETRFASPWLLYLLPVSGAGIGWMYSAYGKSVDGGNNLVMDEIHEPGGGVPLRMAPLVLIGTIVTHLFGGSAGREGTAVQMGGSFASQLARMIPGLDRGDVRVLLMAGVAAGFGGVFGTPVAGMIFALEVLAIGQMSYVAIFPCLVASIVSDQSCLAWGIGHTHYHIQSVLPPGSGLQLAPIEPWKLMAAGIAGVLFGFASVLFAGMAHGLQHFFKRRIPSPLLRPVVGGLIVIALVWLLGTRDYLGLGVVTADGTGVSIVNCFEPGTATPLSWFWKTLFTAVTLSSGFKGGEVTPLFFIGAALGNTLSALFGMPADLFAALGFIAVFSGATNTPLACTVMGVELFGGENVVYYAVACLMAYLFSGHQGIYLSQLTANRKGIHSANPAHRPETEGTSGELQH